MQEVLRESHYLGNEKVTIEAAVPRASMPASSRRFLGPPRSRYRSRSRGIVFFFFFFFFF